MATSWEHLLGGYATNILTDEEKRQLYRATLHDQTLFDALADEEALKAMLADPEARQRILNRLQNLWLVFPMSRAGGGTGSGNHRHWPGRKAHPQWWIA